MKRHWDLDDLIDHFTIMPNEYSLLSNKTGETRLGFAVLLKFFQFEARFPSHKNEIPKEIIIYIAKQLNIDSFLFDGYDWAGRVIKYHRSQIRDFLGFHEATVEETENVTDWLSKHVFIMMQTLKI